MKKIVVLGSTNTDMVISGARIPVPGETVSGGAFLMNPGGKGANQAVAVARLAANGDARLAANRDARLSAREDARLAANRDARLAAREDARLAANGDARRLVKKGAAVFIAKVGDDLFGRETAVRMKKDGIDAKLIVDRENASGTALILVDAKGQNVISVALGANGTLSPDDIAPFEKTIASAAALLMQLETPIPTVLRAAEIAHAAGVPVILNPAPAAKLPKKLFRLVDWMTPNETEAEFLTGVKVTDAASAKKSADALKKLGVKHVLVTMGAKGVFCGECGTLFPCRRVKAVDCVAAGDTFNGAFAVALAEGKSVAGAIAFAQKAAAISVTRPGAQSSVPYRWEVE